jgi:hypothetical protein
MNRQLVKGFIGLKKSFNNGDMIRHIYKNSIVTGRIDKEGYLVSEDLSFTSLSTFATYHKNNVIGRPISTNGWLECEWRKSDTSWQPAYVKRSPVN